MYITDWSHQLKITKKTKSSGLVSSSKYPKLWSQPLPMKSCLRVNRKKHFCKLFRLWSETTMDEIMASGEQINLLLCASWQRPNCTKNSVPSVSFQTQFTTILSSCSEETGGSGLAGLLFFKHTVASKSFCIVNVDKYRFYMAYMSSFSLWYIFILLRCLGLIHLNYTNKNNIHWKFEKSSLSRGAC